MWAGSGEMRQQVKSATIASIADIWPQEQRDKYLKYLGLYGYAMVYLTKEGVSVLNPEDVVLSEMPQLTQDNV